MFSRVAPQVAKDFDGAKVQFGGRYIVQFVKDDLVVDVEIDPGKPMALYPDRMTARKDGKLIELPLQQKEAIAARVAEGMTTLGVEFEVIRG